MYKKYILILSVVVAFAIPAAGNAAVYYVDVAGSDTNSGSATSPWKTIAKANSTLNAGDTVTIRPGTYRETIVPARSGNSTGPNYITYTVDKNATNPVIITGVTYAADLRGKSYIKIDGITVRETSNYWVHMKNDTTLNHSHHNIIENCDMKQTVQRSGPWAGIYMNNTNYNIIRNNRFEGITGNPTGDLISLRATSRYNLIESNKFYYGTHQLLSIQGAPTEYNVIRNNYFSNPYHTGLSLWLSAEHNLIEGNILIDCGNEHDTNVLGSATDKAMTRDEHKGLQLGSSEVIVRKNVFINNGRNTIMYWDDVKKAFNNRIYNNTYYQNYYGIHSNSPGGDASNIIKNNIFSQSRVNSIYHNVTCANVFIDNNNIDVATRFSCAANYTNNLSLDPGFVDSAGRNLSLQSGSKMIDDSESFLTKTTTAKSNSTIIDVGDARYFMNGWGIIAGDRIQLQGQSKSVMVKSIQGNSITVDEPLSWAQGIGVSLEYRGSSPDLGAYEYLASKSLTGLVINGPTGVNENSSGTFTATAAWSDGTTSTVTPTWSEDSQYATISSGGIMTTLAVPAEQTVNLSASYASGGVTKIAPKAVKIIKVLLSGLTIDGPVIVNENSSGTYTAKAAWSDGSTSTVTPLWSENSQYATISSGGVMTTSSVSADQTVTVSASYTSGGVTKIAPSKAVQITNVPLVITPAGLAINGPVSLKENSSGTFTATATWSDGSTSAVTPLWSENSQYATINSGGVLTTLAVPADQTVTVSASYTSGGVTKVAPKTVNIIKVLLSGLTIDGPILVNENSSGTYTAKAAWSDGSTSTVTPIWSENSQYATINAGGMMTTLAVPADQAVTVSASYSSGGVTKVAPNKIVQIAKVPLPIEPPSSGKTASMVEVFEAESGTITAPMKIVSLADASGGAYVASATGSSGTAVYNFNIEKAGKYKIIANVYALDGGSDSFFVKIDGGVEVVWDLFRGNPAGYGVWVQDEVASRGTGTFNAPQYDPFTVLLSQGSHTISFRGRDPNARLDYFYLIKLPDLTKVIEAESGIITAPMQIVSAADASGGAYVTSSTRDSGTAVYDFNIEVDGLYKVVATAYVAGGGSDSFYVKIDNGIEDIWDIFQGNSADFGAWGKDEVSYRGTETFDMPQNDPYAVEMTKGGHTISFRGRDPGARLDSFYLISVSYEPPITKIILSK